LTILTVSDSFLGAEAMSSEERQKNLTDMIETAIAVADRF